MVLPFDTITQSARDTQKLGEAFGNSLLERGGKIPHGAGRVICLWGELGSGKTTFVQGVARGLGITSRLLSPTFIIVRRYQVPESDTTLYHLDLYRTNGPLDAGVIGLSDMIRETNAIVIIEWPERLETALPEFRTDIRFVAQENGMHRLTGNNHG